MTTYLTKEGRKSGSSKGPGTELLHIPLGRSNTVWKGELNILLGKLHTIGPLQILSLNSGSPDDLDGTGTGAMTSSHLVVELGDGSGELQITVFPVHIMGTGTGRITEPDSVILDNVGVLLSDFNNIEDLSGGLLHLTELMHVVPELGLCNNLVGGKDEHAVGFRVGEVGSGSFAANNLVLVHLSGNSHFELLLWGT